MDIEREGGAWHWEGWVGLSEINRDWGSVVGEEGEAPVELTIRWQSPLPLHPAFLPSRPAPCSFRAIPGFQQADACRLDSRSLHLGFSLKRLPQNHLPINPGGTLLLALAQPREC